MPQLLSTERPIIEYELSSSTEEDRKWIKGYTRPTMEDIGDMPKGGGALYAMTARLLLDWSWSLDPEGNEKAPITAENLTLLDPVDFLEIAEALGVDAFFQRMESISKKKTSSVTSSPKANTTKASQ